MDMSLINLIESRNKVPFPIENLKLILYQILAGLGHIHKSGFFHRDIKPENILISKVKAPLSQLFKMGQILANRTQSNTLMLIIQSLFLITMLKVKVLQAKLARYLLIHPFLILLR